MSQFGPKNPAAWTRPPGANQQLNAGLFQNPLIGAQPFAQMGMINAAAFSQQAVGSMGMNLSMLQAPSQTLRMQAQQQSFQQKNRTFSGVVTKMHDNYGFIDDDVFFQVSNVRGSLPRAGDRVMVEASYNPTMPFKWNAYRVQLIGDKGGPGPVSIVGVNSNSGNGLSAHTPPDRGRQAVPGRGLMSVEQSWAVKSVEKQQSVSHVNDSRTRDFRPSPRTRSPVGSNRHRSPRNVPSGPSAVAQDARRLSPPRRISPRGIARRSPRRSPLRDYAKGAVSRSSPKHLTPVRKHEGKREHSASASGRNRSPSQKQDPNTHSSLSPPRRRARVIPRYQCYLPKAPISNEVEQTVMQLRKRYPSLYIPSDFSDASIEWPKRTPIENPLSISATPITFHILHKDVDYPGEKLPVLNPPDLDNRFSAKVVLMSHQGLSILHQKAFGLQVDGSIDENSDSASLKRCINFVVGVRNKEMMAIGGAWSPSLDGDNPDSDPRVLIRTSIRTVRALCGVDLSKCSKWYKMAEIRYYRAEKDRMDTCCLFLPDTSGLMPTNDCYQQLLATLKNQLRRKLAAVDAQKVVLPSTVAVSATDSGEAGEGNAITTESTALSGDSQRQKQQSQQQTDTNKEQGQELEEDDDEDLNPTHWSKLDIKTMKVAELRQELMARDLETKGIKSVLYARLQEAIDREKAEEEGRENKDDESVLKQEEKREEKELTDEDKKAVERFEKEKKEKKCSIERHFVVPKEPGILVYPSRLAKGGKFDCKIVSLHAMLDYRIEDNKEHSFELAVMAECISEMLDRSQAFTVYKALSCALDKDSEKKRRDEAKLAEVFGSKEIIQSGKTDKPEKSEEEKKKEDEKREEEQKKVLTEARKPIVIDRAVFQAFAHFDQNLCGYVLEKDLEEILHSMGLNISRAQLQKLLKKHVSRDRVSYRFLTDSWANKDGTVTYRPGIVSNPPSTEQLSKGNVSKESNISTKTNDVSDVNCAESVMYLGALVNIPQVMDQVARMEADRNVALQKVDVLEAQLKDSAKHIQTLEKRKKRLDEDVEKYRKRLHDAEKCLKNSVDDTVQMKSTIQEFRRIGERMVTMAEKLMPNPKEEEKASERDEKDVKREKKDEKEDKKVVKKKEPAASKLNGEAEEKKELQLVDEVGSNDVGDEPMETDVIVLSEELIGDDEKEIKKEVVPSQDSPVSQEINPCLTSVTE